MADDRIAKNMRAFMEAIKNHAAKFPSHKPYGIAIGAFDAERLGIDHGEEIVPGMIIEVEAGRQSGTFRVLCDSDGDGEHDEAEERDVVAVGTIDGTITIRPASILN